MDGKTYPLLFESIVGSQSYGTAIPGISDIDIKGVYCCENDDILGLKYREQIQIDKDTTYYELGRYINLLGSANPTVLEMLFTDEQFVQYCHPVFQQLRDRAKEFLTKKCKDSFGGMAVSQIVKSKGTNKKMNWEAVDMKRKLPSDFCTVWVEGKTLSLPEYLESEGLSSDKCGLTNCDKMKDCYSLYYSDVHTYRGLCFENSNHLRLSGIPKGEKPLLVVHYNLDGYIQHCRKYKEYSEWLKNRNLARFVETKESGQQIDGKNLSHCYRLFQMAKEIATEGNLTVLRPNREELLAIRRGEVVLQDLIDNAENEIKNLDKLFEESNLPEELSLDFRHELIVKMRKEFWNIWDTTPNTHLL